MTIFLDISFSDAHSTPSFLPEPFGRCGWIWTNSLKRCLSSHWALSSGVSVHGIQVVGRFVLGSCPRQGPCHAGFQ